MSARIQVIKGVEDDVKRGEPVHVELAIFNVRMIGRQFGVWSEFVGNLLRDLGGTEGS